MRWSSLLLACLFLSPVPLRAESSHTVSARVGTNYFGQSLGLIYSRQVLGPLWGGAALEIGSFAFDLGAGDSFYVFSNDSSTDYHFGINNRFIGSLFLAFHRVDQGDFRWLGALGLGISYCDANVRLSHRAQGSPDLYQGGKDYGVFAVFADLLLLEYHPPKDRLFFSLGIKGHTTFLESPQTIVTKAPSGDSRPNTLRSEDGGVIPIPYPEAYLSIGFELP